MNLTDLSVLSVVISIAWFACGIYAVWTALRYRRYLNSLPPSPGNRKLRRWNRLVLAFGVFVLFVMTWNTVVVTLARLRASH